MTELLSVLVILHVYIACENIAEIFISTMELYYYGSEPMSSHFLINIFIFTRSRHEDIAREHRVH
jgi:hypothetical protein